MKLWAKESRDSVIYRERRFCDLVSMSVRMLATTEYQGSVLSLRGDKVHSMEGSSLELELDSFQKQTIFFIWFALSGWLFWFLIIATWVLPFAGPLLIGTLANSLVIKAVKTLAKSPVFARDPRQLQYEVDINRLFLYTSYNRLGKNADEADAEEIIEMASKASVADQQIQVQENVHSQLKAFCTIMDEVLLPNQKMVKDPLELSQQAKPPTNDPAVPKQRSLSQAEVSQKLKDQFGYMLNVKPSQISHKDAGQGLFLDGVVDVGAVIAFYPGVVYSPAYYRYIPGYLDEQNPYLITRYDGTVIDAQPWGSGGDGQELWNGRKMIEKKPDMAGAEKGSDSLSKPLEYSQIDNSDDVLERRNPLALAHFANHPAKGILPNVMICPYDFPLTENNMRVYIPNTLFGNEEVNMRSFGNFWFKSGVSRNSESHVPTLKTVVLVATRALQDEELLLNYRLSNSKRWPEWYTPVDEEEDMRREDGN